MPLVIIQASDLSAEQKKRVGDRIMEAFHREGIHASSVVILFKREDADILLDGGLLIEAASSGAPVPAARVVSSYAPSAEPAPVSEDFKTRPRRTKAELVDLKGQLVKRLQLQGALSSFQAQDDLGLRDCEWAPATLRRIFSELEEEGAIVKQGQKRGTRYVWKGITSQPLGAAIPKLVKRTEADEE